MKWKKDQKLQRELNRLVRILDFAHVQSPRIFAYRSYESSARAYARIWSFPKIFQEVLKVEPAYVIEVLSEKFDKLSEDNKTKVLIHELLHIPRNFSGSLLPHRGRGRKLEKDVDRLYKMFKEKEF
jgi:predicted metallopeptidase